MQTTRTKESSSIPRLSRFIQLLVLRASHAKFVFTHHLTQGFATITPSASGKIAKHSVLICFSVLPVSEESSYCSLQLHCKIEDTCICLYGSCPPLLFGQHVSADLPVELTYKFMYCNKHGYKTKPLYNTQVSHKIKRRVYG